MLGSVHRLVRLMRCCLAHFKPASPMSAISRVWHSSTTSTDSEMVTREQWQRN